MVTVEGDNANKNQTVNASEQSVDLTENQFAETRHYLRMRRRGKQTNPVLRRLIGKGIIRR